MDGLEFIFNSIQEFLYDGKYFESFPASDESASAQSSIASPYPDGNSPVWAALEAYSNVSPNAAQNREWEASRPSEQFAAQMLAEENRYRGSGLHDALKVRPIDGYSERARVVVMRRWVNQGIWDENWDRLPSGLWKHEEILDGESGSETDTDDPLTPRESNKRLMKSQPERENTLRGSNVRERKREASRPIHQFMFQVHCERHKRWPTGVNRPADAHTIAYETVKQTWMQRGIWDDGWGVLPGMQWKHEELFVTMPPETRIFPRYYVLSGLQTPAPVAQNRALDTREEPFTPLLDVSCASRKDLTVALSIPEPTMPHRTESCEMTSTQTDHTRSRATTENINRPRIAAKPRSVRKRRGQASGERGKQKCV